MEVGAVREPVVSFGAEDQRGISPLHNDALDGGGDGGETYGDNPIRLRGRSNGAHRTGDPTGHHREQPRRKTRMVSFLIVDSFSTYNVIIGRPASNAFQAVVSTFHMKLQFVMEDGVGEVLVDQQVARKCYVEAIKKGEQKKSKRKEVESKRETNPLKMTKRKEKEEPDMISVKPQEELMSVEQVVGDPTKVTRIGTQLGSELIVGELAKQFTLFKLEQIPRDENVKVDHLSKIASSAIDCGTRTIIVLSDNTCILGHDVLVLNEGADWRNNISNYLTKSIMPEEKRKASRIQARALGYCLTGGVLYKRALSQPFLRCLSKEE
ncbi:hypothetical protein DH2020_004177 [Rehmannia glutinosa]|uniref:Uncharacterized protein n=1 Tax=Rehmannia glutinosa TaxID=99300 RepID=A0ABR0XNS2_REHGL